VAVREDNCNNLAVELMLELLKGAWSYPSDNNASDAAPLDAFNSYDVFACIRTYPRLMANFLKVCRAVLCVRNASPCQLHVRLTIAKPMSGLMHLIVSYFVLVKLYTHIHK
jgi:hypothetical protein